MREVVLKGGAPWGFRMTGGADQHHSLKVGRFPRGYSIQSNAVRKSFTNCTGHVLHLLTAYLMFVLYD